MGEPTEHRLEARPMHGPIADLRLTLRSLARNPGFTIPAILILTIGITAATAVFTAVDSIVLRPLDYPESDRLVLVCEDHARLSGLCIASPGNTEDLRRAARTVGELGIGRGWPFALSDGERSRGVRGGLATAGFFRALGAQPALGRLFDDEEVGPDNDDVAVLSHAFWSTRFGADPGIIGSAIRLDGESSRVIGVLAAGFEAPFDMAGIQLWKPPHFDPLDPEVRGWRGFRAIGKLAPGASLAAATADLESVYAALADQHTEIDDEWRLRVTPLRTVVVGDARTVLLAFLGAAGLLLLIVCANVASLMLVRGFGKRREFAVRAALGAVHSRLVREILRESAVLAAMATAFSIGLAVGATRLLLVLAPPGIPRLDEVGVDARVLAFAALLGLIATATFGLLPAHRVARWDLAGIVRGGAREGDVRESHRLRNGLVIAELALSVVLLATAGMLTHSFARYLAWEPGFERTSLLAVSAFANTGKYESRAALFAMLRDAEERVAAVPGVASVATASAGPLFGGGDGATPFTVQGWEGRDVLPAAHWYDIGPGYFRTLGLALVDGREFTEADAAGGRPVAIINETFARTAWPAESAVGRTFWLPELDLTFEVVGVVADVPPLTPGAATVAEVYWSNRQYGRPATFFLVRANGDPAALASPVTAAMLESDPDLSLGTPRTLVAEEKRALVTPRFQALVLLAFGAAALALSAVGVYGVVAYAVARRTREMGIRIALGAASTSVLALVLRSSLAIALTGTAIGLLASLWAGRLIAGMLHGVRPTDPVSLGTAALLLVTAATVAAIVPALRATRANPLDAIRAE
jgi:putative ABC transport system permease protein